MTAEHGRLREANERGVPWRKWGPYGRHGSDSGAAVTHLGQRPPWVYQSDDDGPSGICDDQMRLCFAVAIRADSLFQERLLPLPSARSRRCMQADNLPTHSYMRAYYRYCHRRAGCFDVLVEHAKAGPEDILIQMEVKNTGNEIATLHVLPQLWFRNAGAVSDSRVGIERAMGSADVPCLIARHPEMGVYYLHCELAGAFLFTSGGTRAAAHYVLILAPRAVQRIRMLLSSTASALGQPCMDKLFFSLKQHRQDADEFFSVITYACDSKVGALDVRRAFCSMLWTKAVWVSVVSGWLYDRRAASASTFEEHPPTSFRLEVAQVVAFPRKHECPPLESPASLLHTLAFACVDADLAAWQLRQLIRGELKSRSMQRNSARHEWQALKPWAALLMYRLQRPRRPKDARNDLADNFEALSLQSAGGAWAAVRAQSMLEISIELASHEPRYENKAVECYVTFIAAIAALDCELMLLDTPGEQDDDPGLRLVVSERMQFLVLSGVGQLALSSAMGPSAGGLARLPALRARAASIHREHADRLCEPEQIRWLLERVFEVPGRSVWSALPTSMLLIRALSQIEALYGSTIRVGSSAQAGSVLSPSELSLWLVHQHVAARIAPVERGRLLEFCDHVYVRGAASTGQQTSWAGRVAAMICAACGYSPFDSDAVEPVIQVENVRASESKSGVSQLKLTRR